MTRGAETIVSLISMICYKEANGCPLILDETREKKGENRGDWIPLHNTFVCCWEEQSVIAEATLCHCHYDQTITCLIVFTLPLHTPDVILYALTADWNVFADDTAAKLHIPFFRSRKTIKSCRKYLKYEKLLWFLKVFRPSKLKK